MITGYCIATSRCWCAFAILVQSCICNLYGQDSSIIRVFIESQYHKFLNSVMSYTVLILAHSGSWANYYYVMRFLQISLEPRPTQSPDQLLTTAAALTDKVSLSFHFGILELKDEAYSLSSGVLRIGLNTVWDWILRVDMCELQNQGVIPHQLDHGPDTFHQAAAQDFLECQASPKQTNCNIVSISVQQLLILCSIILDLHSFSLVKIPIFLFLKIYHLHNWLQHSFFFKLTLIASVPKLWGRSPGSCNAYVLAPQYQSMGTMCWIVSGRVMLLLRGFECCDWPWI
jgi:hypothetical protein